MFCKSPFAIQKALKGKSGDPKGVKKLRSGDFLIETTSALQTKSFLLTKTFLDYLLMVSPHKFLNSCRGVISEPDPLCTSKAGILKGISDQGVIQSPLHPHQLKPIYFLPHLQLYQIIACESQPPVPLSTSATSTANSLQILSTKARLFPTTTHNLTRCPPKLNHLSLTRECQFHIQ
ncbi:uncharacterized protein TNCV_4383301 [Trichonephila clavipes]|nr:uncharacterized protein TNCV_4383301 [Trichonephila clavipes]